MLAQSGVTLCAFGFSGSASGNGYEPGVSPPVPTVAAGDFLPALSGVGVFLSLLIFEAIPPASLELFGDYGSSSGEAAVALPPPKS